MMVKMGAICVASSLRTRDVILSGPAAIRKAYWKYIDSIVSPPDNDQTNERPNCIKRFSTFIKHRRSDGRQILLFLSFLVHWEDVSRFPYIWYFTCLI
jgi:hypothetical protein